MNITANAASLDWRTNNHGVWKALVKDMAPNSSVTFSDGLTGTVAGRQVTVESPYMPTGFMTYTTDDDTAVFGGVLYGAGTASDSLEAVSGGKTFNMGSVDLGTLTWQDYTEPDDTHPYGLTRSSNINDRKSSSANLLIPGYIPTTGNWRPDKCFRGDGAGLSLWLVDSAFIGKTGAEIQVALSGVILYYELATPTTSTETAQSLALQTGVNNLALNERDSSFTLDYTGTEFTLQLDSTRKYAFSDNGVKSMLTGSTEQAVTGGQDMLVDVTRMFNGVSADIAAVTSWADMAAVMPEYLSNVAYNEGEVVGRSGEVTTAKWNQLVQPQDDGAHNFKGVDYTVSDGKYTWSGDTTTESGGRGGNTIKNSPYLYKGHKYLFLAPTLPSTWWLAEKANTQHYATSMGSTIFTIGGGSLPNEGQYNLAFGATPGTAYTGSGYIQLIDLTALCGAGNEPATVEEARAYCASLGHDLSTYQPYDAGTPMGGSATFSDLHGVGTVRDKQDVVTGEKTVKMGSVDMGTLYWSQYNAPSGSIVPHGYTSALVAGKKFGLVNILSNKYMTKADRMTNKSIQGAADGTRVYLMDESLLGMTAAQCKAALTGVILCYELATPTTSTETPQPLTAVQGLNNVHEQNMSITGAPLTMGYTGTDQTIPAETTSKYLARIDGVDSVVDSVESIDVTGGVDRVIDLTYMFGAGNEPATAADFYKLFPTWLGYAIPYDKGSLVNFKGTGLKSVGFNLLNLSGRTLGEPQNTAMSNTTVRGPFDETKYYAGLSMMNHYRPEAMISYTVSETSVYVNANWGYGLAFPIRCVPGRTYRLENYLSGKTYIGFYTYNGAFIGEAKEISSEAPENAYWCMIFVKGTPTASWTNPCVHLQWSGGRNGDYEPYWDYTRPLSTLTYFEQGMNGRGGVFDEITQRQAVTRLAEVDMEDLEWTESSGSWTTTLSGMKSNTAAIVAENGFKPVVSGTTVTVQSDESPTGKLVYELANPSVVTFPEEVNTTAQVSDYGTESVVPANGYGLQTAPFLGIVKYQDNYARTITKLPENYQSQNSMDALQLVLGQLLNVTLTSRFNSDEQAYGYTVTGDGVPGLIAAALTALAPVTGLTFRGGTYMPTDGMVALPDPTIQAITTIPASTTSYTLGEGVYSHAPNSVPTYTLPAVEDATVVHTARLTVKMSASVLTANFRNSAGSAISYEAPTGDVRSGTLVEYLCKYEPLAGGWAVSARVVMQTEPPPDEIWYEADVQVTLFSSTNVASNTFSNGKGVVKFNNNLTVFPDVLRGTAVKSVMMPRSITTIADHALDGCTKFNMPIIPDHIVTIGTSAFIGCSSMKLEVVPASVVTVGDSAFRGTSSVSIIFKGTPASIGSSVFVWCYSLTTLRVPWASGAVEGAPWGAGASVQIIYNYTE